MTSTLACVVRVVSPLLVAARCRAGRSRWTCRPWRRRRSRSRSPEAPLGSPVEVTYKFAVAQGAGVRAGLQGHGPLPRRGRGADVDRRSPAAGADHAVEAGPDDRIQAHGVRADLPLRRATRPCSIGLYSPKDAKRLPLAGETNGQRAYKVGVHSAAAADRERVPHVQGRVASGGDRRDNSAVEWQWTKKSATIAFRNPKKHEHVLPPRRQSGDVFAEPQVVT